ncbi:MAG: hypothetical protein GX367_02860 [Bacteroidales bacterium]|nr:hypothetical protein [Bacteroidales bacterium]
MTTGRVRGRKYLILSILGFLISSSTFFLVPFASFEKGGIAQKLAYTIGIAFWIGILAAVIFTMLLSSLRSKEEKKEKNKRKSHSKIGLVKFFSNKIAKTFDIIFMVSLAGQVIVLIIGAHIMVEVTILFLLVFSFEMHCIFNGKNYSYIIKHKENNK